MKGRPPRYHQIAQSLRERMVSGQLAPGARLDNQRRLAQDFGVTLMTLRHALEVLERDGLIARRHGLGTFVLDPLGRATTSCSSGPSRAISPRRART